MGKPAAGPRRFKEINVQASHFPFLVSACYPGNLVRYCPDCSSNLNKVCLFKMKKMARKSRGKASKILDETLSRIHSLYRKNRLEPGIFRSAGLKQGWNVVIGTNGQCGMAMSFSGWESAFGKQSFNAQKLQTFIGKDLFSIAGEYLKSDSWHERSIGVAAIVALSQPLILPGSLQARGYKIAPAGTDFAGCLRPDDIAVVVGYGGGIKHLLGKCRELHVTDMRKRENFQTIWIKQNKIGFAPEEVIVHPETNNREVLGKATVVNITGSALVNGTIDELLGYARNARFIAVYGGSAGMIPDVLFEKGVHIVQSSRISDPNALKHGMINDFNMEAVMQRTQTQQAILSPMFQLD
jgi:uncharacterized protein (DUF4213/DUF364 family)